MKVSLLALAFCLSLPAGAAAQCDCAPPPDSSGWSESFVPGVRDDAGNVLQATEVRQFVAFGDPLALYAATGAWMDQGGEGGKGSAMVIRLDRPNGKWQLETMLNSNPGTTTGALAALHFEASKNAQPVNVWTLVASTWSGANSYARNETDHKWYKTSLGDGQLRAYGSHMDNVAHEFWAFVGGKPGIYRGQLKDARPAGATPIEWDTTLELNTVNQASSDLCSGGGRVTGFAEARGKMFASACWRIFVRQDGLKENCQADQVRLQGSCQPRWKRFWDDPLSGSGESGLRGLTTVKHEGQEALLVGSEVANAHITRIDPDTAASVVEFNVDQFLDNLWTVNSGYKIIPYNAPSNLWYGADGIGRRLFGFESWLPGAPTPELSRKLVNIDDGSPQQMLGDGAFFVREAAGRYTLHVIPRITEQPMTAVRDIIASPFAEDCNAQKQDCAIFVGGFDANKSTTQTPCYAAPCTFPPLVALPTHATGFVVKGRITLPPATMAVDPNEGKAPHIGSGSE
jgi:hypothetical protein